MSSRMAAPKGARTAAREGEGTFMNSRTAAPKGARTAMRSMEVVR